MSVCLFLGNSADVSFPLFGHGQIFRVPKKLREERWAVGVPLSSLTFSAPSPITPASQANLVAVGGKNDTGGPQVSSLFFSNAMSREATSLRLILAASLPGQFCLGKKKK